MKHTRSDAEVVIRNDVVAFFRCAVPGARIVHELVCGQRRADVAIIATDRLWLVEIKSARDKLDRLAGQLLEFDAMAHHCIVVADQRWFERKVVGWTDRRALEPCAEIVAAVRGKNCEVWHWPRMTAEELEGIAYPHEHSWGLPPPTLAQPAPRPFLDLLWRDELLNLCRSHRIDATTRSTRRNMKLLAAWHMTGQEICAAVCAALRARPFAEAEPFAEVAP